MRRASVRPDRIRNALLLILVAIAAPVSAAEPLVRALYGLRLGMNVAAFLATQRAVEQNEEFQGLIPGERLFQLDRQRLPPDVANIGCRFFNDQLFKISVQYTKEFSETGWDRLLPEATTRYGKGEVQQRAIPGPRREVKVLQDLARWEDPSTVHILVQETESSFRQQKIVHRRDVTAIYMDRALWAARGAAEEGAYSLF